MQGLLNAAGIDSGRHSMTGMRKEMSRLKDVIARQAEELKELKAENERLRSARDTHAKARFGRKSEKQKKKKSGSGSGRKRGQQADTPGHGPTPRSDMDRKSEVHDPPEEERVCPCCGLPYVKNGSHDSEFIEVEVKAHIRTIRRNRWRSASAWPRLFPQLFGIGEKRRETVNRMMPVSEVSLVSALGMRLALSETLATATGGACVAPARPHGRHPRTGAAPGDGAGAIQRRRPARTGTHAPGHDPRNETWTGRISSRDGRGLEDPECPLHLREALVRHHRRLRPDGLGTKAGADDVDTVKPALGGNPLLPAAPGDGVVGDGDLEDWHASRPRLPGGWHPVPPCG